MSETFKELCLFVILKVRSEHYASYLKAMQDEVSGARSEPGNLGFDLFEDIERSNVLYLLEHWASRGALQHEHARQSYYRTVRAMEAQALDGDVHERQLEEIEPNRPRDSSVKSVGGAFAQVIILESGDDGIIAMLDRVFRETVASLRQVIGNRTLSMFRNLENPHERLLLDIWSDEASRDMAWGQVGARGLAKLLEDTRWSGKTMFRLGDRGNDFIGWG